MYVTICATFFVAKFVTQYGTSWRIGMFILDFAVRHTE